MRHIGKRHKAKPCRASQQNRDRNPLPYTHACFVGVPGAVRMLDNYLFFTELVSLPVNDVKGRRLGRVKDAALVPVVNAYRIDRYLVGGGTAWWTVRCDQIRSINLEGIDL